MRAHAIAPHARPASQAAQARSAKSKESQSAIASGETRARLLDTATRLFAEHGFAKVTVRDICTQAGANVAAVNYHFGDKEGLYHEVIGAAIGAMRTLTAEARSTGAGKSPEVQFAGYVRLFVQKVIAARGHWIQDLMRHELGNPTPALDRVANEVIRPRTEYLSEIVAAVLGCERSDPRVADCVFSVQSQMFGLLKHPVASRILQEPELTGARLERMAEHITGFSLGGLRKIKGQKSKGKSQR